MHILAVFFTTLLILVEDFFIMIPLGGGVEDNVLDRRTQSGAHSCSVKMSFQALTGRHTVCCKK